MAATRKPAAKTAAKKPRASAKKPAQAKDPLAGLSVEQIQAAVRAGQELEAAGLPLPAKVKQITEAWTAKQEAAIADWAEKNPVPEEAVQFAETNDAPDREIERPEVPQANNNRVGDPNYLRTIYNSEFHLRWEDDNGKKRRLELKARGQRGDMHPISKKDAEDTGFQEALRKNLDLGVIEVISGREAMEVAKSQTANQQAFHPALAAIRNEKGEAYAPENIRVEAEFNSQGVTVARLDPVAEGVGNVPSRGRNGVNWEQARGQAPQAQQGTLGGNPHILSDGFAQSSQFVPVPDSNVQAQIADQIARQRRTDVSGPAAAGITSVSVNPVQPS